ncbi:helix-turn-helix domain-containing protein [Streptomyces inhibens]|uniref:helix-turn-helix domain-containing protein n=1 Tax=Streptomyces inhibens TaxID=2293571 RepID=UPI0036B61F73
MRHAATLPVQITTAASKNAMRGELAQAFLSVNDAAQYLGVSPNTLYVWRHRRQGPPSFRMGSGGRVMYRLESLDAWIQEQEEADSRSNVSLSPVGGLGAPRGALTHAA